MHDSRAISHCLKYANLLLWVAGLLLGLTSQPVLAFVEQNVSCTQTGAAGYTDLGTLAPGENIQLHMTADCKVLRTFPVGAALSYTSQYLKGSGNKVYAYHVNSGQFLPEGGMGTTGSACVPNSCVRLPVGSTFSYDVIIATNANQTSGDHYVSVSLFDTSLPPWTNYADYHYSLLFKYTVGQPACSLGSASTMTLAFGTLSSNDFASTQKVANITMNCIRGTQVTATLVPTQAAISGAPGVSATTLRGLSMAATWADNATAVTFNSPRTLTLAPGANTIGVAFRPRLNTSASPTGDFASQYTLNITYR